MNKNTVKNFTVKTRTELINAVQQKISSYEFNSENIESIAENIAYTWFIRIASIRFLQVNELLPNEIKTYTNLLFDTSQKQYCNKINILFKDCTILSSAFPEIFCAGDDLCRRFFPEQIFSCNENIMIKQLLSDIPQNDWLDNVEIIGSMYQYWNTAPKAAAFAKLKNNVKISNESLSTVTQLFTPNWIVKYLLENSLGRLWCECHTNFDRSDWKYYVADAPQNNLTISELEKIKSQYNNISPEEIKIIDPCLGCGHIMTYAFDMLMKIYSYSGYSKTDAALLIAQKNLFGFDIDNRACNISCFALQTKIRKYIGFEYTKHINLNFFSFDNLKFDTTYINSPLLKKFAADLNNADMLGSLYNPDGFDYDKLHNEAMLFHESLMTYGYKQKLLSAIKICRNLSLKYDVVVTNPPYLKSSSMNPELFKRLKSSFPESKSDMFAIFIEQCRKFTKNNGFFAMITPQSWMFLSSYEKLRYSLVKNILINMAHLGSHAFDDICGEIVQTTAFVFRNSYVKNFFSTFIRLVEPSGEADKSLLFLSGTQRYFSDCNNFLKISKAPFAYWLSSSLMDSFSNKCLRDVASPRQGLATSDNKRFIRFWFELPLSSIGFNMDRTSAMKSGLKWFPYNKGGSRRKWYGNDLFVVNYQYDGSEIKKTVMKKYPYLKSPDFVVKNQSFYFREAISWSLISTNSICFRYKPCGFIFDVAGMSCFSKDNLKYLLGLCNSKVSAAILNAIAPTINYQVGDIASIPVIINDKIKNKIEKLVNENIEISKADWDSFETSWNFKNHPLI